MDLGDALAAQDEREPVKVVSAEYTVESSGRKGTAPVVQLVCRDADRERKVIRVDGFRPYFYITASEFVDEMETVVTERRIIGVEVPTDGVSDDVADALAFAVDQHDDVVERHDDPMTSLSEEPLVRLYTMEPTHVGKLRDAFERTFEADIPFTERFKIDTGIALGASVPPDKTDVQYQNWASGAPPAKRVQEISGCAPPDVAPRVLSADIEVATEGEGFPNPGRAKRPVTAITAHDNYTDKYVAWVLTSDRWDFDMETAELGDHFEDAVQDRIGTETTIEVFDDESNLLAAFNRWVARHEFDLYTGWNSDDFDYPYLIKRSLNMSAYGVYDWAPVDMGDSQEIAVWEQGDRVNMRMAGLVPFDMLDGYKKTVWKQLKSYTLDHVSKTELGVADAKIDVEGADLDEAWHNYPLAFIAYNVRDTEAVVMIEGEQDVIDLYENMMSVTGADYEACHSNGVMLDSLFLRQAHTDNIALPTNTEPEQGNFHGAYVFPPVPGKHENVVYPDLASLYPFILWTLNISPDTFYRCKQDLLDDGYTEDDAFVVEIDKRDFKTVPSGEGVGDLDESQYKGAVDEDDSLRNPPAMLDPSPEGEWQHTDPVYFLKPDVKEGFIRKVVDDLVDMKYEYKGTDMYAAVKRVTNCFTSDTDVMTPDGVRNIRELDIGDDVYSIDPETGEVELKPVVETYAYPDYDDGIIDMETSTIDFGVTPNHRMLVASDEPDREYEFIEAGEMNEYTNYQFPSDWTVDHGEPVETIRLSDYLDPSEYEVRVDPDCHGRTFRSECSCEPDRRDSNTATYIFDGETYREHRDEIDTLSNIVEIHAGNNYKWVPEAYDADDFIEFLGWYVAEGSIYTSDERMFDGQYRGSSTTVTITKYTSSAAQRDRIASLLERMGIDSSVDENGFTIASKSLAMVVDTMCGTGASEKRLPDWVFDGSEAQKQLLFTTLIDGDGNDGEARYTTISDSLRDDVMRLCVELGKTPRYRHDGDCWRIRYGQTNNSIRMHRSAGETTTDDGVYCVEVADNNTLLAGRNGKFQFAGNSIFGVLGDSASAGKGFRLFQWELAEAITLTGRRIIQYTGEQYTRLINEYEPEANAYLVGGDTDSVISAIPGVDSYERALELAQRASEEFQTGDDGSPGLYDEFMEEEFNVVHGEDDHRMDVEIESVASACFFIEDMDADEAVGVKKRYAQDVVWDEDDGWLLDEPVEDRIDITGFEYVRSDVSDITTEAQYEVLRTILTEDDPSDSIYEYVSELVEQATAGEVSMAKLGRPVGINNDLDEYGRDNDTGEPATTPSPSYRGAKYADTHFEWERITPGTKPLRYYVNRVRSDEYPEVYTYDGAYPSDSLEVDDPVDAIAVTEPDRIPDGFAIDYETMVEKEIRKPLEPIVCTVGERWEHIVGDGRQSGLDSFC